MPPVRLTAERDGHRCVSRADVQPSFSREGGTAHGRRKCSRMLKTDTGGGDTVPCPHADRKEKTAVRRATRTPPFPASANHPGGARATERARRVGVA